MNQEFLQYYNSELRHFKEAGEEFAKKHPAIAGKINSNEFTCEDPHTERMLDAFAGMAAKVHHKLDSGYPRLSQALIENLFPSYLMPIPSMGIAKFNPDFADERLLKGYRLEKGISLHDFSGTKDEICHYQTAHGITLWPIEIAGTKYYTADMSLLGLGRTESCRSCLCLELNTISDVKVAQASRLKRSRLGCVSLLPPLSTAKEETPRTIKFSDLDIDNLEFYLRGADIKIITSIYKMLVSNCTQIIIRPRDKRFRNRQVIIPNPNDNIRPRGFDIEDSLFPFDARTSEGNRLFRKYFVLPQSFMFIQIREILEAIRNMSSSKIELIFTFDSEDKALQGNLKKNNFNLFCTPIVNLFEQTLARIELNNNQTEFHLVGNKLNPQNSEIIKIAQVKGFYPGNNKGKTFNPLYSASSFFENKTSGNAYYTLNRIPRALSEEEKEHGTRSNYIGSEAFISIVDQENAPYSTDLEQLEIRSLCSNRDLPVVKTVRKKNESDFEFKAKLPLKAVKRIYGPTIPYCDHLTLNPKETIKNISLNFLSLYDPEGEKTAKVIRKILSTYAISYLQQKYIKGIVSIKVSEAKERFYNNEGMFTYASGLAIEVLFDEQKISNNYFLLGMILDRFFQYAAPVNVFTKTTIKTVKHGTIVQHPIRSKPLSLSTKEQAPNNLITPRRTNET